MDRLLNQFFGDIFVDDADEELATDLSERWAAFAKTGDPNHEGSKVKSGPWMRGEDDEYEAEDYWDVEEDDEFDDNDNDNDNDDEFYDDEYDDEYDEAAEPGVEGVWGLEDEDFELEWEEGESEEDFRERVLKLLGIEVAVDTKHRTVLRRRAIKQEGGEGRRGLWSR